MTESVERTPSIVFSRIGHTDPTTMTTTFIASVGPISTTAIGRSTGGGTARKNSSIGSSRSRSQRLRPISVPAAMPTTIATRMPMPSRARLGSTSVTNAGPIQVSTNASKSSAGDGKNCAGATVAQMPQITTRMIGRPIA